MEWPLSRDSVEKLASADIQSNFTKLTRPNSLFLFKADLAGRAESSRKGLFQQHSGIPAGRSQSERISSWPIARDRFDASAACGRLMDKVCPFPGPGERPRACCRSGNTSIRFRHAANPAMPGRSTIPSRFRGPGLRSLFVGPTLSDNRG